MKVIFCKYSNEQRKLESLKEGLINQVEHNLSSVLLVKYLRFSFEMADYSGMDGMINDKRYYSYAADNDKWLQTRSEIAICEAIELAWLVIVKDLIVELRVKSEQVLELINVRYDVKVGQILELIQEIVCVPWEVQIKIG